MPNSRGRAADRAETRRKLLDAAADVFAEYGFAGAPIEEIATRAGFTRGAFYSNFADKAQLFLALMADQNAADMAAAAAGLARGMTLLEVAVNDPMPPEQRRVSDMLRFEFFLYAARRPELAAALRAGSRVPALKDVLETVAAERSVELRIDSERAAHLLIAVNTQVGLTRILGGDDTYGETIFSALLSLLGLESPR